MSSKTDEIRRILKEEYGYNRRQVSVRADGLSIDVTIKNPAVREDAVREVAFRYEKVHRCEMTGDILSGGNTFVNVEWDRKALAPIVERLNLDAIPDGGQAVEVGRVRMYKRDHDYVWEIIDGRGWEDREITERLRNALDFHVCPRYWGTETMGQDIARAVLFLGDEILEPLTEEEPAALLGRGVEFHAADDYSANVMHGDELAGWIAVSDGPRAVLRLTPYGVRLLAEPVPVEPVPELVELIPESVEPIPPAAEFLPDAVAVETTRIPRDVQDVLEAMEWSDDGTAATLPPLDRKLYLKTADVLKELGGKWNRKAKAILFQTDGRDLVDEALGAGAYVDTRKTLQFYETPADMAQGLAEWVNHSEPGMPILEPSAGKGAIARAIRETYAGIPLLCVEIHTPHADTLREQGFNTLQRDFLECTPAELGTFESVVMNPPFSKGQDARHVMHAYEFLCPGGRLVAVMSRGAVERSTGVYREFGEWLERVDGEWFTNDPDAFKASGTQVRTVTLVIDKPGMVPLP